jgi:hypothetical protein
MPLFDATCLSCDWSEEDILSNTPPELCPSCGSLVHIPPAQFATAGIIWSNVHRSDQLGVQIESNAQMRAFQKENPNIYGFAKGSSDDIRIGDKIRNRAERVARKQGFRDHEDKISTLKKQKAERALTTPTTTK